MIMGMSNYKGKLTEVKFHDHHGAEHVAMEILKNRFKAKRFARGLGHYDTWVEYLTDEFYTDYHVMNDNVYEVTCNESSDSPSDCIINPDGTIDFNVRFHDGGASLSDAIGWAMEDAVVVKYSSADVLADIRNKMGPVAHLISMVELTKYPEDSTEKNMVMLIYQKH